MSDARYEQALIPRVTFMPIPSLWGHTAGAASNPADLKFLNDNIAAFFGKSLRTIAAVICGVLLVVATANGQESSPLGGVWTLNRALSEMPREIGFNVDWMPPPEPGRAGGSGGTNRGRRPGGGGGGSATSRVSRSA